MGIVLPDLPDLQPSSGIADGDLEAAFHSPVRRHVLHLQLHPVLPGGQYLGKIKRKSSMSVTRHAGARCRKAIIPKIDMSVLDLASIRGEEIYPAREPDVGAILLRNLGIIL